MGLGNLCNASVDTKILLANRIAIHKTTSRGIEATKGQPRANIDETCTIEHKVNQCRKILSLRLAFHHSQLY